MTLSSCWGHFVSDFLLGSLTYGQLLLCDPLVFEPFLCQILVLDNYPTERDIVLLLAVWWCDLMFSQRQLYNRDKYIVAFRVIKQKQTGSMGKQAALLVICSQDTCG